MVFFTLIITIKSNIDDSNFIEFFQKLAVENGYIIEVNIDFKNKITLRKDTLSFNSKLINNISSLPYLLIQFNSDYKKFYFNFCFNSLTVFSNVFSFFFISIFFYLSIINGNIISLLITSFLILINIVSIFKRLYSIIEFYKRIKRQMEVSFKLA
jgi:hypothetical protein